jgi:hypothetical protein
MSPFASHQGQIRRAAIDIPLGHEDEGAKAGDVGGMLTKACVLGYWMLLAPAWVEGSVIYEIESPIIGEGKACRACSAHQHSHVFVYQ